MAEIPSMNDNLNNLMKEAQKMQQRMQEAQAELTKVKVQGKAGGGTVTIEMNGRHEVTEVKIKPSALEEDEVEVLEVLIRSAFNDAVAKVETVSKEKIAQLTAGLNLPTDFAGKQ